MLVSDIIRALESFAPPAYQEGYDNSGLQVGDPTEEVRGILLSLDVTEAVVEEAISRKCNLIVAHHPLIFNGLKRVTGASWVERTVQLAIRHGISIYAAHTNLDNIHNGVNALIANKLELRDTFVLAPKTDNLMKLYTYVPVEAADKVREALFVAGAGSIGEYRECSFNTAGTGTFRPGENTNPAIGEPGGKREEVAEIKIEALVPRHLQHTVLKALKNSHPYEEVAYELISLQNPNQETGAGMMGVLPEPMEPQAFLALLKERMQTPCIRHTALPGRPVQRIAVCGGSGSFLLRDAIRAGADVLVTADFKYHQFFDAEGRIVIADIGHYESEQFTVEIFDRVLKKNFPNFAILLSTTSTNPVNYYC
jgi:dinuclear metal center YbgI/SA1388 family protein